ncbi:MAG: hydantoinase/oxoprolinase family protein, partial [Rhodospirillaceae bacterium]|nr:hydantoinase/oxoprolinase family protein [Rhodospirillaceae bacterium]
MSYRVGVDIGGTFTDFFAFNDSTLETHALKVPSRPDKPGAEVLEGVRQLEERFGIAPSEIAYFSHGTTVGVNTVIQR